MAIFHCSVSHGSRKGGQSGAAKVDYIMRCGKYIVDAGEVIGACAGHLPSWAGGNPRMFFAAADEYERLNGRLFTQALFAIPNELSDRDALLLSYHYAEAATENGAPYALAVHRGGVEVVDGETVSAAPQEADEEGLPPHNRHGHLLICERIDDGLERTAREWFRRANKKEPALGGAAKDRTMNGGDWVPEVRSLCADYINYGLKRAGVSERVTCESHETRIARAEAAGDEETAERLRLNPPGIHLGPTAWAIEKGRPGRPARASWRGELNRTIAAGGERLRGEVDELNAKLTQLDVQAEGVNERLEAARRVAAVQFEQRAKALQGTSIGGEILNAVHAEMVGESAAPPSVMQRGEMLEAAEQRFGAVLDLREEGFQETSVGSRYLDDATQSILGARQSPTLPQRELIITTAEGRLTQDLDRREAMLRASVACAYVLGAGQLERADEYGSVLTLVQREQLVDTAERRLEAEREEVRRELDRREEALRAMSTGADHLSAAARELFGEEQAEALADRESMIDEAERRVEEELRGREVELRSVPLGAQYLSEAEQEGLGEGAAVLAAHDVIVTRTEQRLEREMDSRERALVSSAGSDEVLLQAFSELGADDEDFGDGSSLPERLRILERAERWHGKDRAEDEEQSAAVDDVEAMLKETATGARHLAAARQEVVDEGQEPSSLTARETVVRRAWSRVEREQDDREASLSDRRCGGGRDDVDGAVLCAMKLAELEEGEQQSARPHPGRREQALAWAERQMDRVDALREAEALELVGRPRRPADIEQSLDVAEKQQHETAERRRGRVAALSEDERVFFDEKLAALDPQQREKPAHVDAAVDHARARVAALDEENERRRAVIEQTPGDGYARLLAAGFAKASRQQKVEALTAMEAGVAEDFDRREERIRSDGEGEAFLRRGRREVLGDAERQPETLPERGRVIAAAEQERERQQHWEERRDAGVDALERLPGGLDLFHAHLADRDPEWDRKRNDRSSREHIDAALAAARSDTARLGRLRDVLSNEVDAARYREELGKVAGQFKTSDLDNALAAGEQERQERETRQWGEERDAGVQALERLPGGLNLYHAHLADRDPEWDRKRNNKSSREHIDAALTAARSDDGRLERLRVVLSNEVDAVRYREELGKVAGQFKTLDLDRALEAAEQERERRLWEEERRDAGVQALKRLPGGLDLYHAHLADRDPAWGVNGKTTTTREHIDAVLAAARSDAARLDRLRVVLSNEVDAARYREELGKVAGQFKTSDLDRALEAAEQERQEREIERRKAIIAKTPGAATAAARLHELGFGKTRQKSLQALTAVETDLTAEFARRERTIERDAEGKAFLRDARVAVLGADRAPETLPERGGVLIKAEALRTAAMAERMRQAAAQRVTRLQELFDVPGGDEAFFAALDERKPGWRESGTQRADVDVALDLAEQRVDRTQAATGEHEVVVFAEQKFPEATSAAWRQTRERFPPAATHARVLSGRLADRARARALAAERTEPPAPPALLQRLFEWLRRQVEELLRRLGLVKAEKPRPIPTPAASMPVPEKSSSTGSSPGAVARSGAEEPSATPSRPGESEIPREAAEDHTDAEDERQTREELVWREHAVCRVPGGADRLDAEERRILGGEDRPLSLEEWESALRAVDNRIQQEMRALAEQVVVAEVRTKVGFAPPIPVLRAVGRQLQDEYDPDTRPGRLVAALETLPEGIGNLPTDEEETLRMALDEERLAEAGQRLQAARATYQRDLKIWKEDSGWLRGPGWPKPKKPPKPKPTPPSPEDGRKFRQRLIDELVGFVRHWINRNFEKSERGRPLRPGEGGARPATTYDPTGKHWQRSGREGDGQSR